MKEQTKKVLIHTCCAICSGHPIKLLRELGYEPVAYFFNPNIQPETEYKMRLEAQKKLCETLNCELIIDPYVLEFFEEVMSGFENHEEGSERCKRCFELRLLKSAQKAKELGIENFTTSISISPHKNFNVIKEVGEFISEYFSVNFMDFDFKKREGFLKTNAIAKELNLHRQNYCGCSVSMKRFTKKEKEAINQLSKEINKN